MMRLILNLVAIAGGMVGASITYQQPVIGLLSIIACTSGYLYNWYLADKYIDHVKSKKTRKNGR